MTQTVAIPQTLSEAKALEIIRLIFRGELRQDNQEAMRQVAAIIDRTANHGQAPDFIPIATQRNL